MMATFFPTSDPGKADLRKQIKDLQRQVRLLTERADKEDVPSLERTEITFSLPGIPTTTESGDYLIKDYAANLTALTMTVKAAGGSDSTLDVLVNGTTKATVTLPAGDTLLSQDDLMIEVEEWDRVSVQFTSIGSGITDTVIHIQVITSADSMYQ